MNVITNKSALHTKTTYLIRIVAFIVFLVITTKLSGQEKGIYRKLEAGAWQEDVKLLHRALQEGLMELYMYQDSAVFEKNVHQLLQRKEQLTVKDLYTEIQKLLCPIGSDHLKLIFPEEMQAEINEKPLFPMEVRIIEGKVYCFKNHAGTEPGRGDQVISVNGKNMNESANELLNVTKAGGLINASKHWIFHGTTFSEKYYLFADSARQFNIEYLKQGETIIRKTRLNGLNKAVMEKQVSPSANATPFTDPYGLKIEGDIAVMNIEQFYENISEKKFNAFYERSFKTMEEQGTKYLLIDVRRNRGGWQRHAYHLMQYFIPEPFSPITSVLFKNKNFSFLEYTNMRAKDLKMNQLKPEGKYYRQQCYDWLTDPVFKPRTNYFFKGKVFILTNEGTCSAACFFTNAVNTFSDEIVFVGRESEAVSGGASSGFMPILTLPNSGLKVRIPLSYFKAACKKDQAFGRGLVPDHIIEQDLSDQDSEMDFTLKLIEELKKKTHK